MGRFHTLRDCGRTSVVCPSLSFPVYRKWAQKRKLSRAAVLEPYKDRQRPVLVTGCRLLRLQGELAVAASLGRCRRLRRPPVGAETLRAVTQLPRPKTPSFHAAHIGRHR